MVIKSEVREFNTGRRYTGFGQRIRWVRIQEDNGDNAVVFEDQDRMIFGIIPIFFGNMDLVDDRWVLNAYDDRHYRNCFLSTLDVFKK